MLQRKRAPFGTPHYLSAKYKLQQINWRKRKNRSHNHTLSTWNKFNLSVTLVRRNTFINLGFRDYLSTLPKLKQKKIRTRFSRKYFTQTISYISAGNCGLTGSKKAAHMANITIAETAALRFKKYAHRGIRARLIGSGRRRRKEIIKGFIAAGLVLRALRQILNRPHNGVRHKKRRRK